MTRNFDAIIVGGGMYGCMVALHLKEKLGYNSVCIVEREHDLISRASLINQARVHNGYHYPRSLLTAQRSRDNFKKFSSDFEHCIVDHFTKVYCIAKSSSHTSADRFEHFCRLIGAPYKIATPATRSLFNTTLVEQIYEVDEVGFDAIRLREQLWERLLHSKVEVLLGTAAQTMDFENGSCVLTLGEHVDVLVTNMLFNCTYAGLKHVNDALVIPAPVKYEVTEMVLLDCEPLAKLAVTVMDGPFFSIMPYPPENLLTLSHVKYTPHFNWRDEEGTQSVNPYDILSRYDKKSRAEHMLRDAARYMPILRTAKVIKSIFEVKILLTSNDKDDGRPIYCQRHDELGDVYSILGGKIDNVYDVLEYLSQAKSIRRDIG